MKNQQIHVNKFRNGHINRCDIVTLHVITVKFFGLNNKTGKRLYANRRLRNQYLALVQNAVKRSIAGRARTRKALSQGIDNSLSKYWLYGDEQSIIINEAYIAGLEVLQKVRFKHFGQFVNYLAFVVNRIIDKYDKEYHGYTTMMLKSECDSDEIGVDVAIEEDFTQIEMLDLIRQNFTPKQQQVIRYIYSGYTQAYIVAQHVASHAVVERTVRKLKSLLKDA